MRYRVIAALCLCLALVAAVTPAAAPQGAPDSRATFTVGTATAARGQRATGRWG